jgi:hypothetical protein
MAIKFPPEEPLRQRLIPWQGRLIQALELLSRRHKAGVDAPGRWDLTGADPQWIAEIPTATGENDPRPEIPIPCRALTEWERLEVGFGGQLYVVRQWPAAPASGNDSELIREIHGMVKQLVSR